MKKRWMLSTDGGVTFPTEVTPLNLSRVEFVRDKREANLAKGRMFIRRHLSVPLEFHKDDYALLYPYERNPNVRCDFLYIRQERRCGSVWKTFWTGRFNAGSGNWDHCSCWCSFPITTVDQYTCFLDHIEEKQNVLQVAPVVVNTAFILSFEFDVCWYNVDDPGGPLNCATQFPEVEGWTFVGGGAFDIGADSYDVIAYGRRREVTICVGGVPVPPAGSGWILLEDNCDTDGTAVYVREITEDEIFNNICGLYFGTCTANAPTPPVAPECSSFYLVHGCSSDGVPVMYICLCTAEEDSTTARPLEGVMQYLIDKMGCDDVTSMVSDFFEINPAADAPGYTAGLNYVTGQFNQVAHLTLTQKSDAAFPGASEAATVGELTMAEALEFLLQMFNVYWDITPAGELRIEHWVYWTFDQGLDLSTGEELFRNKGLCKYSHLDTSTPKYERFEFAEAQGIDFARADIIYECKATVTENNTIETTIGMITTDIVFVNENPDQINIEQGFVMLANTYDGSEYHTIVDLGVLSGNLQTNAPLSWANLLDRFFRHNRYYRTGNMNKQDVTFAGTRHTIEQVPLTVKMCCDLIDFDPNKTVKTELGQRFLVGRQGTIFDERVNDMTNTMTVTLRYGY